MEVESHPRGYGAVHLCSQDGGIALPEVPHEGSLLLLFLHPQCLWFSAGDSHHVLLHLLFLEIPITVLEQMALTPLLSPHKPRGHHLWLPGSHSDPDFLTELYVQDLWFALALMHRHADLRLKHNCQSIYSANSNVYSLFT